ncbi:MAG: tRNA (N6-isopentenyl adenosine(37)-C2)-methylthiotransferase MiaB [Clostridia bacterium]|nr:tRNA (N6-isopentenyl adenosine(37)-C2)-methylthiotransferase MiaB [Clostridia bacterium]
MEKRYTVITYGCQMNVHESEKIAGILEEMGYVRGGEEDAQIIVFNTCCIRENAENHAFGNIGALKKRKKEDPDLLICVGGCMMQEKGMPEEIKRKFPFVDVVFGTHNLYELRHLIEMKQAGRKKILIDIHDKEGEIIEGENPSRTSYPNAWVNINYGCNNFCTYCIVPYVRGRERSRKPEHILSEVEKLVKEGYKEITLLGQNVNSYGKDLECSMTFPELLDKVASIEGEFRLRFMTSHPKDFNEELVKVIAKHDKIPNLIHLPVQSGSDRILSAMNRRYTSGEYLAKVKMLRFYLPDAELTSDIIVGFPGETDEDFEATMRLVKEVDFASAFTFVYSKRKGTKAAEMENQVPEEIQKKRIMSLIELVNAQTRAKSEKYLGKEVTILCEDYDTKKGMYLGRDEYGRMGYFKSDRNRIGDWIRLKITDCSGISLYGEEV